MAVKFMDFIPIGERDDIRNGTSSYDCSPVLLEVIKINEVLEHHPSNRHSSSSGEIIFDAGTYYFKSPVDIKSNVILSSDAGIMTGSKAILKFKNNCDGLRFHRGNTIGRKLQNPSTTGAANSVIKGLQIISQGGNKGSGILMRCRMHIEDCVIRRFADHGIEIVATANSTKPSREGNANGWTIQNTRVDSCGKHGLYIEGADTNTGYSLRFSAVSNGGYGVYDSSFLGNTHIAAHVSNNNQGSYFSDGKNARNVFIGCYTESPQRSYINHPATIIGGLFGSNDGTGQRFASRNISPFAVFHSKDDRNITTKIGWAGKPLAMIAEGDHPTGWGFTWRESTRTWVLDYANLNRRTIFHLTTRETGADDAQTKLLYSDDTPIGGGQMILPKFLYRNSHKRYEFFEANEVMKRLEKLENEVQQLKENAS